MATMDASEPIAIVGLALRFPGDADNVDSFWNILSNRESTLTEIPSDRFNVDAFWHPNTERGGTLIQRKAHFLKQNIASFDAGFFAVPPNEANSMDPQQRILLEVVYESLENAGLTMEDVSSTKTACYVGAFTREYEGMMARDEENVSTYHATGNGMAMLANRISWFYNLKGPSLTLDTACSSSLTGLHLACQSLKNGEATMAILGGVNLFFNPDAMFPLTAMGFLSPDGQCYAFDHRANGYVRGEGFGSVILEPLSVAIKKGHTIRAVVRSTGLNQDGHTPGITLPNGKSQETLIRETYAAGGVDMSQTRYFEAHGTGTPAGDPIEASAIAAAFETSKKGAEEPLYIGAVKSNIGHLEGSSGLAGLIKTICVLEKGLIPPNTAFEKPNPRIPVESWNIKFPLEMTPWPHDGLRRASINSFGYGGSNAHAILDDAFNYLQSRGLEAKHCTAELPPRQPLASNGVDRVNSHDGSESAETIPSRVFVWSTSDKNGSSRISKSYSSYIRSLKDSGVDESDVLRDLSYTLAERRGRFSWRTFAVASSLDELADAIENDLPPLSRAGNSPKLGYVFSGQGAQWAGMGRELFLSSPVYRESILEADEFFQSLGASWSLVHEIGADPEQSKINEPMVSQAACTALQVALIDLMNSWGVSPTRVVGHSSGEIAAAYCIGALDKQSAWKVAYFRGVVSQKVSDAGSSRGGMMAVGLSEEEARDRIAKMDTSMNLMIACVNSSSNVTVSGDIEAIEALYAELEAERVFVRKLNVSVAYHSRQMNQVAAEYKALINDLHGVDAPNPSLAMFSSVSGKEVAPLALQEAEYWVQNLVSPVRFSDALYAMCTANSSSTSKSLIRLKTLNDQTKVDDIVEIGPQAALRSPVRQILGADSKLRSISYYSLLSKDKSAIQCALSLAGNLFSRGQLVELEKVNSSTGSVQAKDAKMLIGLPAYPWNHSEKYWFESRLSKDYRFRKHPRHDLLGAPVADWNPSEPRWRHFLRTAENPWIKDHKITNSILYPAAGMLIMAIEASRQLADPARKITGFQFRDISFNAALTVPEGKEGVETMFYMRPHAHSSSLLSTVWNEFHLDSHTARYGWREHCRGMISIQYEVDANPVDGKREDEELDSSYATDLEHISSLCQESLQPTDMYEYFETIGLQYGPTFRTITDVNYTINRATCTLEVPNLEPIMPQGHIHDHLIHPITLDGVLQILFPAIGNGATNLPEAMIPAFIGNLWIANEAALSTPGYKITGFAKTRFNGPREAQGRAVMLDTISKRPVIVLEGLKSKAVTSMHYAADGSSTDSFQERKLTGYEMQFKPDVDLLTADQKDQLDYDPLDERPTPISPKIIHDLELLSLMYISRALKETNDDDVTQYQSHHQKYVEWMKHQLRRFESGELEHQTEQWAELLEDDAVRTALAQHLESTCADGRVLARMGPKLVPILRQEIQPLELMMQDDLLSDLYENGVGNEVLRTKLASYIDLLSFKNPNMDILEIGAGTGGTSFTVLKTLSKGSLFKLSSYTYTDISAGFFEDAKDKFATWEDKMTFQVLDVEKDPANQGYEAGKYDLVIASNVLHATSNLRDSLQNARKLLKPGGKLVLFEICHPLLRNALSFGLLPGWWRSKESYRQWGPTISESEWDKLLRDADFGGVDVSLRDYEDPENHHVSLLVASAKEPPRDMGSTPEVVIVTPATDNQQELVATLREQLELTGYSSVSSALFNDLTQEMVSRKAILFVDDINTSVLQEIEDSEFKALQAMLISAASVVWLSWGSTLAGSSPGYGLVTGLGRVIRAERNGYRFTNLQLSDYTKEETALSSESLKAIMVVFQQTTERMPGVIGESEYIEKDGIIYINRLTQAHKFNEVMTASHSDRKAKPQPFGGDENTPQRALKLEISAPGMLSSLRFVDDDLYGEPLQDAEIEIEVKAVGLNFRDVMIAMGQLSDTYLGDECAGIVTRVGAAVKDLQKGDRVFGVAHGSFRTYYRDEAQLFQKMPDNMSFEAAAALPLVYCTAYYGLMYQARLRKGQSVLIHAAAGGVGQAAIILSQRVGAEIFVTVGTAEKKEFIQEEYGIPDDHIFYSRDLSFSKGIMRMTQGRGVDVVLNSLSGEALKASWQCVAHFGTFVELGRRDIDANSKLDLDVFIKNVSFTAVNYAVLLDINKPLASQLWAEVTELARKGEIREAVLDVYSYSQLEVAFRKLQGGKHIGKIVLKPSSEDIVDVIPQITEPIELKSDVSYLVAGGLGGLGRSMIQRLVDRGAKNLILVSRSGAASEPAKAAVESLQSQGVKIEVYSCDVSNRDGLSAVLDDAKQKMPPIRGCIQSAMVLRDAMFESMTTADFRDALKPKVDGTWNLHTLLPPDLDFFVMLASASGVTGTRGQANYAAANTYQDALAYHRVSQGQHAIAIDLGLVLSVGYVAENHAETAEYLKDWGFMGIREEEFLTMIEYAIDPANAPSPSMPSQVTAGIESLALMRQKGLEEPYYIRDPLFSHLRAADSVTGEKTEAESNQRIIGLLQAAESLEAAAAITCEALISKLSKVLSYATEDIDARKPLHAYGVDSLVAVVIRYWLMRELAADLAVFDIMAAPTIAELSTLVAEKSNHVDSSRWES